MTIEKEYSFPVVRIFSIDGSAIDYIWNYPRSVQNIFDEYDSVTLVSDETRHVSTIKVSHIVRVMEWGYNSELTEDEINQQRGRRS